MCVLQTHWVCHCSFNGFWDQNPDRERFASLSLSLLATSSLGSCRPPLPPSPLLPNLALGAETHRLNLGTLWCILLHRLLCRACWQNNRCNKIHQSVPRFNRCVSAPRARSGVLTGTFPGCPVCSRLFWGGFAPDPFQPTLTGHPRPPRLPK